MGQICFRICFESGKNISNLKFSIFIVIFDKLKIMDMKRFIISLTMLLAATTMLLAQEASKKYGFNPVPLQQYLK